MSFETVNPTSGEKLKTYSHLELHEAEERVQSAWRSFQDWRRAPLKARATKLAEWAKSLREIKSDLARQMTLEMGKPLAQSKAEIDKCIFTCEFLAAEGPEILAPRSVESPYRDSEIAYEPLGPILAIMPWNFPLWQTVRFAAPSILVGNTILLKHSDQVRGSAELIVESLRRVSDGMNLMSLLPITHETAASVMGHPLVRGVTFTGSTAAGKKIAETAGRNLKKHVLELGGSDAYVVLNDAPFEKALKVCVEARLVNNGQSCVAAKRFILEKGIFDEFCQKYVEEFRQVEMSDPLSSGCRLGPLAHHKFQKVLHEQVQELKDLGGRVLVGGRLPEGPGAFYPATVIAFEKNHPDIGKIETFGPVAVLIRVEDENEALRVANDSPFGLGAALFTRDEARGRRLMVELEAGFVALNDQVKSDVRLAFGGVKDSGYGRELSMHGLYEFCNIKTRAVGSI